jgi:uncharacterized protein YgbK (DUF1537 family)
MTEQSPKTAMRLAFYGDDFTGSTDALEVLTFAGLRCALFLQVPSAALLEALGPFDAVGVTGHSRAMSPDEMDEELPPVLAALAQLPVPLVHYKVCSTFDSHPDVGSIGRVMDLARQAFGHGVIPVVAATPALGRYCAFGHLFARSATDGQVHRIDRHPIMRVHPVTPMTESDLARHLSMQTRQTVAGVTLPLFERPEALQDAEVDALLASPCEALLFDGTRPEHLTATGRHLERLSALSPGPMFAVGSSGLEYALTQWWGAGSPTPWPASAPSFDGFSAVAQVLVVSASASALSAQQVDVAVQAGFAEVALDVCAWLTQREQALADMAQMIVLAWHSGHSVVVHTARGTGDVRIGQLRDRLMASGLSQAQAALQGGRLVGECLGELTERVLLTVDVPRLLLSGGDTSSTIMQRLGPQALQVHARLAPGAPLCKLLSDKPHLRQLEVALKGGQMGTADFFVQALSGREA